MEILLWFWDLVVHLDRHLEAFVAQHGAWVYALLFLIVFCETGLVVTPFLPGDSLLFAAGVSSTVAQDRTVGLKVNEPGSFEGYTLLPPLFHPSTYLIDHETDYGYKADELATMFNLEPPEFRWKQYDFGGTSNVVDTYVGYLRRKIEIVGGQPLIQTVRGVGYRLEVPERLIDVDRQAPARALLADPRR